MPERVTARVLEDAGLAQRPLDGTLDDRLVQVMAAALAGESIHVVPSGREHPLPAELASGVRVLPRQRVGRGDPAGAGREILAVLPARQLYLADKAGLRRGREHRHAVFRALAAANDQLVCGEVYILDAQLGAFQ